MKPKIHHDIIRAAFKGFCADIASEKRKHLLDVAQKAAAEYSLERHRKPKRTPKISKSHLP
jgi:hypothetical protein